MTVTIDSVGDAIARSFAEKLREQKIDLADSLSSIREYAASRLTHLITCVNEPGYQSAVAAEAENVLLFSASVGLDSALSSDARLLSFIEGALSMSITILLPPTPSP